MDKKRHWEQVYHSKPSTNVSWFEKVPSTSLELIRSVNYEGCRIIDVGGGQSHLVDQLLQMKFNHVAVLASAEASDRTGFE